MSRWNEASPPPSVAPTAKDEVPACAVCKSYGCEFCAAEGRHAAPVTCSMCGGSGRAGAGRKEVS
jgi:hypothetical protein